MKFRLKQLFKMLSQHIIFPFIYFINRWRKTDERLVVFADAHHDFCPPHMEQLHKLINQEQYRGVDYFFDVRTLSAMQGFKKMVSFMKLYSQAAYVVICDNFLPVASCRKKKSTKVIQLWHGCGAFKKFGFDAPDDIPSFYHGNVYKNYDMVTVSGLECVKHFTSAMHTEVGVVCDIGVSHTDRLFDADYIEACKSKFRYAYLDAVGKKVVLWAPTFRGNAGEAKVCGEDYIDSLQADKELGDNIYIVKSVHPHLQHDNKTDDVNMTTDELMLCADVLITDYSSVFFEFLLIDKPIIFFAPDYRGYIQGRGFYLDYDELPGYVIKGNRRDKKRKQMDVFMLEELKSTLNGVLDTDKMAHLRKTYRDKYMNMCDGQATVRIKDTFFAE